MKPRPPCPANSAGLRDNSDSPPSLQRERLPQSHPSAMLRMALLTMTLLLPLAMHPARALAAGPTNTFTASAVVERFGFSSTGSMGTARWSHTATLLADGKVLVAGGADDFGLLSSAELYDPANGTWSATGNMSTTRSWHTATPLADGRVLVAGGWSDSGILSSAEVYDPATGNWSATGSMATVRYVHTATLLADGRVLVAGGFFGSSAELYDLTGGTWSATGSMATARGGHTATLLANGRVLVAGGGSSGSGILSSAEVYDGVTGTWSATGSLATDRFEHTATLLANGRVLVAGGLGYVSGNNLPLSSAELYDPATGNWSAIASMSTTRRRHSATLLVDGRVLVAGGADADFSPQSDAELYDPANGTWSTTGSLGTARYDQTATLLADGKVLVAGGTGYVSGGVFPLSSAELGSLILANCFTGTLTLPSGWVNSASVAVGIMASASGPAPDAAALSNDGSSWGGWLTITPGVTLDTSWNVGADGANRPVSLRLRDVNEQVAVVVTGTVSVDTAPPVGSVEVVSDTVASAAPALLGGRQVTLALTATDDLSGVGAMQVSNEPDFGGAGWQAYDTRVTWTLSASGTVYARFQDRAGNVSNTYSASRFYVCLPVVMR